MEIKDLYPMVLMIVLVGIILGIGILVMDKFGDSAQTKVTATNESITVVANTATLTYTSDVVITNIANATDNRDTLRPTVDYNYTSLGVISFHDNVTGDIYVIYNAEYDSIATTSLTNSAAAISEISSSWLSLIITIAILAIILGLVITSFGKVER